MKERKKKPYEDLFLYLLETPKITLSTKGKLFIWLESNIQVFWLQFDGKMLHWLQIVLKVNVTLSVPVH